MYIYLTILPDETRNNYLAYLARKTGAIHDNNRLRFNCEKERETVIGLIREDNLYGWGSFHKFSNHISLNEFSVCPDGMKQWIKKAYSIGILVVRGIPHTEEWEVLKHMHLSILSAITEHDKEFQKFQEHKKKQGERG